MPTTCNRSFSTLRITKENPAVICQTNSMHFMHTSTIKTLCVRAPTDPEDWMFSLSKVDVIRFRSETVAAFIAVVGILSIVAQTLVLGILMRSIANKNTILLGLGFQILQLAWMTWAAGAVAAMSSITFPVISAILSRNADSDQQDVVQGMITGIRGLCNCLGPAFYGFIFYLFHMELTDLDAVDSPGKEPKPKMANPTDESSIIPGPPFLFGACSVLLSLLVALFIPEYGGPGVRPGGYKKYSSVAQSHSHSPPSSGAEGKEPLLDDSCV
ncbi:hippocampus abundant transcript 1 protein-like [Oncorhynchus masou masou]|uniref:hippocampus abundant transcript 1 protein-like n=1 Tax=Oncorhynchus masou masou TaxID=90313 RepID=UPI0031845649